MLREIISRIVTPAVRSATDSGDVLSPRSFQGLQLWHDAKYIPVDEEPAVGYRLNDQSTNTNHGKLVTGRAMTFDGVADECTVAAVGNIKTVALWVDPDTTTEAFIDLNGTESIEISAGTITLNGTWTGYVIYVDGAVASTMTAAWHRLVVTTTANINASAVSLGSIGASFGVIAAADVQFWDVVLDADDAAYDYNNPEKLATERPGSSATTANLTLHWPMIEGADTTNHYIYDNSGNGNDGVNVAGGASFIVAQETIPQMALMGWTLKTKDSVDIYLPERPARDGKDVDGTALTQPRTIQMLNMDEAGIVPIPDDPSIQNIFDGGGTFMAWIRPTTTGAAGIGRVFDKARYYLYLHTPLGGTCYLKFSHTFSGDNGVWRITSRDITFNQYTLVAVTYDADTTTNNPTMYINGVAKTVGSGLDEITAPTGTRTTDVGSDLYVGNRAAGDYAFDGPIDEPAFYSSIPTATQILNYYNANKARYGL